MSKERLVGGITMYEPVVAPVAVLSLGNGFDVAWIAQKSDFWVIHATQKWSVCTRLASLRSLGF